MQPQIKKRFEWREGRAGGGGRRGVREQEVEKVVHFPKERQKEVLMLQRSERILVGGVPHICRQSQASAWLHATLHMAAEDGGGGGRGRGRASLLRV